MTENEQPYKIPDNWQWIEWRSLGKFISGTGFKKEYQKFTEYEIPFYKVNSLNFSDEQGYIYEKSNTINENIRKLLKAKIIPINSIIFAKIGEAIRLNRKVLNKVPCCIDNNMMAFVPNKVSFKYVYYWSHNVDFYKYAKGSIVPSIRKSELEKILLPVPSLDEQKRIVEIIESLFAKLDRSRIIAQKIVDGYELRRGKILYDTFKRLDCESSKIGDVCDFIGGGTPSKKIDEYWNGDIPWASVKDVKGNYLFKTIDKITELGLKNSSANLCEIDDLLLVTRMAPGKTIISKIVTAINQDLKIVKSELPSKYLHYYFNYIRRDIENKSRGTTVNGIKVETIKDFEIPIPSIEEQREIVRHLDSLLTKEWRIKELAEQTLQKIRLMKKTILARAFRGKL